MEQESNSIRITSFEFEGKAEQVNFVETGKVKEGVECDVYEFADDKGKDLGVIRIVQGHWTPPQKVKEGGRTIEGYMAGQGKLVVIRGDGVREEYRADSKNKISVDVKIGDIMQWQADDDSDLQASEVCFPPFSSGRFEDLPDRKL